MRFPVRLPPPSTTAAAAAATVGAVLAAVALHRYLSASRHRPPARVSMSAAAGAATTLVAYGKSAQEQELLASAAGSVALGEGEPDGEVSVALAYEGAGFDAAVYMSALRARRFGRWMLWTPRIGSTQDLVARNFAKLPVGVVCVADVQFKGRGRSKNVWESPPGCLMFSFTSQMQDARKLPLMQYVVCLSITEAIKELCRAKGLPELDVRIKWPNDLYLKGLKVGGILCTSSYEPKVYNICVGLNVDNAKPTTCLNAALQEANPTSPILKREDILAYFFNKFENLFEIFLNQGFQALEEQYYNSWLHCGQRVVVQDAHESKSGSVVTIQGLTPTGYLYAIDEDNKSYELHPDGNSFDFFTGLVRRKMEA
ncbi:biotin--protein ligase 2-like isoform X2 [Miscanthus floridulus]|uniref:biotin--protein ligase 2-like isoform X2 n=1 Tax=Miscanthus floridulus TaxID=154761 RepID=UPI00345AF08F